MKKKFKLDKNEIKRLIEPMGGCIATDKITVEGLPVGYMYKEKPNNSLDNGWRFMSGTETQEYLDNVSNSSVYDTNTIVNYDNSIIPYLNSPVGTQLERIQGTDKFRIIE